MCMSLLSLIRVPGTLNSEYLSFFWCNLWQSYMSQASRQLVKEVCVVCVCFAVLPGDVSKDGDSKADPFRSHHTALEGGDHGWNEVLDTAEAGLANTPWLIHQKHDVGLNHCPACWGKESGLISVWTKEWRAGDALIFNKQMYLERIQSKFLKVKRECWEWSPEPHVLFLRWPADSSLVPSCWAFFPTTYICHAGRAPHKSPWIFNETQVSQRDYQYSEHSSNKTLVQRWGTLRIIR